MTDSQQLCCVVLLPCLIKPQILASEASVTTYFWIKHSNSTRLHNCYETLMTIWSKRRIVYPLIASWYQPVRWRSVMPVLGTWSVTCRQVLQWHLSSPYIHSPDWTMLRWQTCSLLTFTKLYIGNGKKFEIKDQPACSNGVSWRPDWIPATLIYQFTEGEESWNFH